MPRLLEGIQWKRRSPNIEMTGRQKLTPSRGTFSTRAVDFWVWFPNLSWVMIQNLIVSYERIYCQLYLALPITEDRFQQVLVFFSFRLPDKKKEEKGEGLSYKFMFTLHAPTSTLIHKPNDSKKNSELLPRWSSKLTWLRQGPHLHFWCLHWT